MQVWSGELVYDFVRVVKETSQHINAWIKGGVLVYDFVMIVKDSGRHIKASSICI